MKTAEIIGKKFGRWTPIERVEKTRSGQAKYICRCDCGTVRPVDRYALLKGSTKSCGCYRKEQCGSVGKSRRTHGGTGTRLFSIWRGVVARCRDKSHLAYEQYGGRGISVELSWLDFENFKKDMEAGYKKHRRLHGEKNTTIERLNVDGDYSKDNCVWATWKQQGRNKRNTRTIEYRGEEKCVSEWAEEYGLKANVLWNRVFLYGWDINRALTE